MTLREYLFFKEITIASFAKRLRLSSAYLSHIVSGRKKPSQKIIEDIERLTGGQVTGDSLFSEINSNGILTERQENMQKARNFEIFLENEGRKYIEYIKEPEEVHENSEDSANKTLENFEIIENFEILLENELKKSIECVQDCKKIACGQNEQLTFF